MTQNWLKKENGRIRKEIAGQFGLDPDKPLISFVGRLVGEKAADLLPDAISQSIYQHHGNVNFLVLGSGDHFGCRKPTGPNEKSV
jgi:starch synthase